MLKDSLPRFVRDMKEMALLLGVDQNEIDRLEACIEEMTKQFYISSATYALDDWEKEFGVEKNSLLTYEQRRIQILAKLNTRSPSTIKMIENLVVTILGEKRVEVVEDYEDYSFSVIVKSDHILENMFIASEAVKKARPAHLNYEFINKIARSSLMQLYFAAAGRKTKEDAASVDARRRKQTLCIGNMARTVRAGEWDADTRQRKWILYAGSMARMVRTMEGDVDTE